MRPTDEEGFPYSAVYAGRRREDFHEVFEKRPGPIRRMTKRLGRWQARAILLLSILSFIILFLIGKGVVERWGSITPEQSIREGCCTITVRVMFTDGDPAFGGSYTVETQAGRHPRTTTGSWSDGKIQILVGRDWVGRVRVDSSWECRKTSGIFGTKLVDHDTVRWTDLTGGPYGTDERMIRIDPGCR